MHASSWPCSFVLLDPLFDSLLAYDGLHRGPEVRGKLVEEDNYYDYALKVGFGLKLS